MFLLNRTYWNYLYLSEILAIDRLALMMWRINPKFQGVTGVLLGLEDVLTYTGTILIYSLVVSISRSMSE